MCHCSYFLLSSCPNGVSLTYKLKMTIAIIPDSNVHGANTGPTWVLSAPDGPHVGPMNYAIRDELMPEFCIVCHLITLFVAVYFTAYHYLL